MAAVKKNRQPVWPYARMLVCIVHLPIKQQQREVTCAKTQPDRTPSLNKG